MQSGAAKLERKFDSETNNFFFVINLTPKTLIKHFQRVIMVTDHIPKSMIFKSSIEICMETMTNILQPPNGKLGKCRPGLEGIGA
jgi:hypothetical protein